MNKQNRILAGASERQQFLAHAFNDNTIRFTLHYPGLIDPEILAKATETVIHSVDVLHGSFSVGKVHAWWHIHDRLDRAAYFHHISLSGGLTEAAIAASVQPMHPEAAAKLRVTLVENGSASALVVSISHLCMDGGDARYLLSKLVEGYNRLLTQGSTEGLTVKNGTRAPEQLYQGMRPKEIRMLMKNPLPDAKSYYPFPTEEAGAPRCVYTVIPAPVMAAARQRAKAVGASANDLLIAAMTAAYAGLPGVDRGAPISVTSMIDLRRHCPGGDSAGLSNLSGALPTLLEGVPADFSEILTEISRQTRTMKEDPYAGLWGVPLIHTAIRTGPMALLLKVAPVVYGKMSVGLTNLGNLPCAEFALGDLIPTGGIFGGPLKKKPGMQVSAMSFDGECVLACYGQYGKEDAAHIQKMLDAMGGHIRQYADR